MNKLIRRTGAALILSSTMTLVPLAEAAQGVYSTKALLDANVYSMTGQKQEVGEVDNVVLDENMHVNGIIVTTGSLLGMGGKQLFVKVGQFTVKTSHSDNLADISYKVYIDSSEKGMKQFPIVDQGWWVKTKKAAVNAWDKTKSGAQSAWENTKDATSDAYDSTKKAVSDGVDTVKDKMH